MEAEVFDSVDPTNATFREQAYRLRQVQPDVYDVKVAVINPFYLLPYPQITTVGGFMRNIDKICDQGAAQDKFNWPGNNAFLNNFSNGMRSRYFQKYMIEKRKRLCLTFSAMVDFNQSKMNDTVSAFHFDPDRKLYIANHDMHSYGSVYPMMEPEDGNYSAQTALIVDKNKNRWSGQQVTPAFYPETDNIQAAQNFEISARKNKIYSSKYNMFQRSEGFDTLGSFMVWGASLVIKKAASSFCLDNPLEFISTRVDHDRGRMVFKSVKDTYETQGALYKTGLTTPLSEPADLFNLMQLMHFHQYKRGMLGPKEVKKLIPELQNRYNDGDARMLRWQKNEERKQNPEFKIVELRPDLIDEGKASAKLKKSYPSL